LILLISASCVAGITGKSHRHTRFYPFLFLKKNLFMRERNGGLAQMVEYQPSKPRAPSAKANTTKKFPYLKFYVDERDW
jgi:hypothetical protein